LESDNQAAVS